MLSLFSHLINPSFQIMGWEFLLMRIAIFFLAAWIIHRLAPKFILRMVRLRGYLPYQSGSERQKTLVGLLANLISFFAFTLAVLFSLGQFVALETLIWVIGLFSAAFGLGARPLISDLLAGISFLFEDTFGVGEKVEILHIEGVIDKVNLRTTWLYAPTGELHVIPNGEIRSVRNFSRGRFSIANIKLQVEAQYLKEALPLLAALGEEAISLLPNLLEPWQVISETGILGQKAELTLIAKANYGKAAEMRPKLLALLQERLSQANIELAN